MVRKFPPFRSERKKRSTSEGTPQFPNRISGKLPYHLTSNRNSRIFSPNGKLPMYSVYLFGARTTRYVRYKTVPRYNIQSSYIFPTILVKRALQGLVDCTNGTSGAWMMYISIVSLPFKQVPRLDILNPSGDLPTICMADHHLSPVYVKPSVTMIYHPPARTVEQTRLSRIIQLS